MVKNTKKSGSIKKTQDTEGARKESKRKIKKRSVNKTAQEKGTQNKKPKESSLNQILQNLVDTLRSRDANQLFLNRLDRAATRLKSLRIIITNIIILILVFFLIFFIYREVRKDVVLIEPFEIPQELEKQSFTSRAITNELIDKINHIRAKAKTIMERKKMTTAWSESQVDLEIQGGGISFNSVIQYIKRFFKREPTCIVGEVVKLNNQIYIIIRVSGKPEKTISVSDDLKDLEEKLLQAAEHIYQYVEPFILASYLSGTDKCIKMLKYVVSHEPLDDDSWAYNLWGLELRRKRDYEGAKGKYRKAIELDPKFPLPYNNWGVVLFIEKNYEGAIAKYQKAIEINPKYAPAYHNWGAVLYKKEDWEGAIAKYQKAIEIKQKLYEPYYKLYDPYYNWGIALAGQGDWEGAIAKYQKAIEINPEDIRAYVNLSDVLCKKGDNEKAITICQRALEFHPKNAFVFFNWGEALKNKKDYKGAIAKFQKAIELDQSGMLGKLANNEIKQLEEGKKTK